MTATVVRSSSKTGGAILRLAAAVIVSAVLVGALLWGPDEEAPPLALRSLPGVISPGPHHRALVHVEDRFGTMGPIRVLVWGLSEGLYHLDGQLDIYRLHRGQAHLLARIALADRIWAPSVVTKDVTGDGNPEVLAFFQRFDNGAGVQVCRAVWQQGDAIRWSDFSPAHPQGEVGIKDADGDGRPEIFTERPFLGRDREWVLERRLYGWTGEAFQLVGKR